MKLTFELDTRIREDRERLWGLRHGYRFASVVEEWHGVMKHSEGDAQEARNLLGQALAEVGLSVWLEEAVDGEK